MHVSTSPGLCVYRWRTSHEYARGIFRSEMIAHGATPLLINVLVRGTLEGRAAAARCLLKLCRYSDKVYNRETPARAAPNTYSIVLPPFFRGTTSCMSSPSLPQVLKEVTEAKKTHSSLRALAITGYASQRKAALEVRCQMRRARPPSDTRQVVLMIVVGCAAAQGCR